MLGLILSLLACIPAPCRQSCADFGAFFEACADTDGLLCDGGITADCIDDSEAYEECIDSDFDADGCEYECESSGEAKASCLRQTRFHYGALETKGQRDDYADACAEESDFTNAIAAKDCATVCEMLGSPIQ